MQLTEDAIAGRLISWSASRSGKGQVVQGLVPDGIAEVTLIAADGSTTVARVSDNGYGADLGDALEYVCIDDKTVLSLGVPGR